MRAHGIRFDDISDTFKEPVNFPFKSATLHEIAGEARRQPAQFGADGATDEIDKGVEVFQRHEFAEPFGGARLNLAGTRLVHA